MEIVTRYFDLIVFLALLTLGYTAGSFAERKHYASIVRREREQLTFQVMTAEAFFAEGRVKKAFLVSGSAVISIDYFKRMLAILRNIFGGRIKAYESLVDRARREAILRMKEQAIGNGAHMVVNLRLETSTIGNSANRKGKLGSVEVVAYGTAVALNPR
ncbi:MAG: YbjQ family protein [Geobacteraceae bacterium]|nr:YbjQ family protein [Geobacteraceae bacterium]